MWRVISGDVEAWKLEKQLNELEDQGFVRAYVVGNNICCRRPLCPPETMEQVQKAYEEKFGVDITPHQVQPEPDPAADLSSDFASYGPSEEDSDLPTMEEYTEEDGDPEVLVNHMPQIGTLPLPQPGLIMPGQAQMPQIPVEVPDPSVSGAGAAAHPYVSTFPADGQIIQAINNPVGPAAALPQQQVRDSYGFD